MKKIFAIIFTVCISGLMFAQQDTIVNLGLEIRADYQREYIKKDPVKDNCGFKGQYLNLFLNGNITDKLSYSFRHRLNKLTSKNFFDATDWIYLKYQFAKRWDVMAGKLVVAIGGYEYDRAPIDLYITSEFWNNIPCYRFGVNLGFAASENDRLLLQFSESPFRKKGEDTYGYSLMWYGTHGFFNTMYSVNFFEYEQGKFINYISLGNLFKFGDFSIYLDYMNRAASLETFFQDMSVMGELAYTPHEKWNIFLKGSYCMNRTDFQADYCVLPDTEITRLGGGLEFFPLPNGNKNLRLHLVCSYAFGENGNEAGTVLPNQTYIDLGIKWKMNLISFKRKPKENNI